MISSRQNIEKLICAENNARYILKDLAPNLVPPSFGNPAELQFIAEIKANTVLEASNPSSELRFLETAYGLERQVLNNVGAFANVADAQNKMNAAGQAADPGEAERNVVLDALRNMYVAKSRTVGVDVKINVNPSDIVSRINQIKEVIRSYGSQNNEDVSKAVKYIEESIAKSKPLLPFSADYKGFVSLDLLAANYFEGKMFVEKEEECYKTSNPNFNDVVGNVQSNNNKQYTELDLLNEYRKRQTKLDKKTGVDFDDILKISQESGLPVEKQIALIKVLDSKSKAFVRHLARNVAGVGSQYDSSVHNWDEMLDSARVLRKSTQDYYSIADKCKQFFN